MEKDNQLVRGLTLTHSISIIICGIIGSGILFNTAIMAQYMGSPILVLVAWIAAGLISLAGALTYAELGAMLPNAGGEYVYLRKAYGDIPAFLHGWLALTVGAASPAALGVASASLLLALLPNSYVWVENTFHVLGRDILWQLGMRQVLAVMVILFIAGINCMRVTFSGLTQSLFTATKLLGIADTVHSRSSENTANIS